MMKSKEWRLTETKRTMGKLSIGGNMLRREGFREGGIKTFHFEYIGSSRNGHGKNIDKRAAR
jgi:hypothetical protein